MSAATFASALFVLPLIISSCYCKYYNTPTTKEDVSRIIGEEESTTKAINSNSAPNLDFRKFMSVVPVVNLNLQLLCHTTSALV